MGRFLRFIMIDLHMHSTASDGSQTAAEIIRACLQAALRLNAITDHDNIDAQEEAAQESARLGRPYLTGVEISVQHRGELHILGYGFDRNDAKFRRMMEDLRASRVERIHYIMEALKAHNVNITLEDVEAQAAGNTLGRPHVALALVAKRYAASYREAFETYLNEGGLCYVQRRKLSAPEAIALIRDAGGLPVVAHPGLITTDDLPELVRRLADAGLAGLEAYYPAHSDAAVAEYCRLARDLGLFVTCGSDSHGAYREAVIGAERRTGPQLEAALERLQPLVLKPRQLR